MYPNYQPDPRRSGGGALGHWMLAVVAIVFLWGTLVVMNHQLH